MQRRLKAKNLQILQIIKTDKLTLFNIVLTEVIYREKQNDVTVISCLKNKTAAFLTDKSCKSEKR